MYKCALRALREFSVLPVCRLRGTAASRKRQNDLLSGRRNFCVAVVAAVPKIIRALSADAHLVVSLLRRETVRSCGGVNGAELPMLCQRSGEKIGTGCAIVIPSHATLSQLPSGQGCAPTPRQRLTAREKIPRTAHRSRTRQTENRGAPRLWRGFRFCD